MKLNALFITILLGSCFLFYIVIQEKRKQAEYLKHYPKLKQSNQVDVYHGIKVKDPFRELENNKSPITDRWIREQNILTESFLSQLPDREAILNRLTQLQNYERYGLPSLSGDRYFFRKNNGLQNQSVIYTAATLEGKPRVIIDPNALSKDGSNSVIQTAVTDDGLFVAYSISIGGSDWQTIKVRNVETGLDLNDTIEWVKYSPISWDKKGEGFYYSRYPQPKCGDELHEANLFHTLYYHKLGTDQSNDRLIYERKDHKDWLILGCVSEDNKYLLIHIYNGCQKENAVFYQDLSQPDNPIIELLKDFDASYSFVGNDGPRFWFHTTSSAPNGRLISVDITNPDKTQWQEVIPESKDNLRIVSLVGHRFFANYMHDVHTEIKAFDLKGCFIEDIELPGIGTATGFKGKINDSETFFAYTSFTTPTTIYRYDIKTGLSTPLFEPKLLFDPNDFTVEQVFYTSKDGTKIPMFISYKNGIELDKNNPTILYGYGGFGLSVEPAFSTFVIGWLERGGIYCVANIRGGGEYGEIWHQEGMKLKKQNGFDDFISAAEYLFQENYTKPDKLAIKGGSNGGLLVGAVLNQRPELFGVAVVDAGLMDMLRFNQFTIGKAWESEYGSPQNPEEFKMLYSYSPYHNIRSEHIYPAILVTTSDRDDRVIPCHSFKYIASLQSAQKEIAQHPFLIRIATNTGHGAGRSTKQRLSEIADNIAFILHHLK
ncbi:MAG: prolyl oligopeptidase family serine peptidase [Chlamydiales bacterium]